MEKIKIQLKEIDLSKAKEHQCPSLNTKDEYLVLVDGRLETGYFNKEWYGLNFLGFYGAGLQFDAPGTNHSGWQQVWKITRVKA